MRLIDVADLISMLRFERHADLADLLASAAEMFFLPGTIKLGIGGDYNLDWGGPPQVVLDLEIRPRGVTIYARLTLEQDYAGVEINHIVFDEPHESPQDNAILLANSLRAAAFRPFRQAHQIARPAACGESQQPRAPRQRSAGSTSGHRNGIPGSAPKAPAGPPIPSGQAMMPRRIALAMAARARSSKLCRCLPE